MENSNEAAVQERWKALAEFQEKRDLIKAQERAERAKKPPFVVPAYYRPTTDDSSALKPSNGMRRLSAGTTQKNVAPRVKCGTISGSRDNLAAPLMKHRANIRGPAAEGAVEQSLPVAQAVVATERAVDRPKANLSAVEEEEESEASSEEEGESEEEEEGSDGEEEQSDDDDSNGSLHEPAIISGASAKTAATGCSAVDVVDVARRPPRGGNWTSVHLPPETNVGRRLCAILRLIGFSSLDSAEDSDLDADEVDEEETDPQIVLPAARANNVYAEVSGNGISSHQVVDSPKSSKMRRRSEAVRLAADVSWIYNCTPEALAPSRERKTRYVGSYRPEALSPTDAGYANSLASARRNKTTSSITPAKKVAMTTAEKESARSSSAPPGARRVASGFPMKLRSHSHQKAESLNDNEHGNDESNANSSSVYHTPENGESYFWDEVFSSASKIAAHQRQADLDLGPLPTDDNYPKLARTPESLKRRARRETCMEKEIVQGILDSTASDVERTPKIVYDHAYETPSSILKKPDTPHSSQPKSARFAPGITSPPPRIGPLKRSSSSPNTPMSCQNHIM